MQNMCDNDTQSKSCVLLNSTQNNLFYQALIYQSNQYNHDSNRVIQ